jgi:hypothetical protein
MLALITAPVLTPSTSIAGGDMFREAGAAEVSANGWSADTTIPLETRPVYGVAPSFTVRDGPAGDLLLAVVLRYDRDVEGVSTRADEGGYNRRAVRGEQEWSDHASGTAVDVNTTCRPLGSRASDTFNPTQVAAIRALVDSTGGAVEWGGDYDEPSRGGLSGARADPMHFALAPNTSDERARHAVVALGGIAPPAVTNRPSAPGCRPLAATN